MPNMNSFVATVSGKSMRTLIVEWRLASFEITLRGRSNNYVGKLTKEDAVRLMKWLREAIGEDVVCIERCGEEGCEVAFCRCGCHAVEQLL